MTTYKLFARHEPAAPELLERIEELAILCCALEVEENYIIKRYKCSRHLFYVHYKDGTCTKICHYQED